MAHIGRRPSSMATWVRLGLVAGTALSLAACQSAPGYGPDGELKDGELAKPNFPVRAEPAPTVAAAPAAPVAQPAPPPSTATSPVTSQPLPPPVTSQPLPPPPPPPPTPAPTVMAPPPAAAPMAPQTRLAATGRVVDADGPAATYTVKPGQGVDAIARELGTTRKVLVELNDLKAPYGLKPGQKLKAPGGEGKAYVVASGDTLFSISRRFGVHATEIADLNDFNVNAPIRPGQRLLLPKGFRDTGPVSIAVTTTSPAPLAAAPAAPMRPTVPPVTPPRPPVAAQPSSPPPTSPPLAVAPPPPPAPRPAPTPAPTAPVAARPVTPPAAPAGPVIERSIATAAQVRAAGAGKFVWPVRGRVLSEFGPKADGQRNDGVNIAAAMNTPVRAAAAGEVIYAGDVLREYGNLVLIQHPDGFVTAYGHLARINVKMKDKVSQNQEIGTVGQTGGVSQPQLHFETRYARTPADSPAPPVDPMLVLPE